MVETDLPAERAGPGKCTALQCDTMGLVLDDTLGWAGRPGWVGGEHHAAERAV